MDNALQFVAVKPTELPRRGLMKRGCSCLRCGHDIVTSIFAYKGGVFFDYRLMSFDSPEIIHYAKPNIVYAPFDADY